MKKGLTEIVFILDKSGSMSGLEADTIGGYNSFLEKQKKVEGEAFVSTVLFSDRNEVVHDRVPIEKIEPMNEKQYSVGGCTALLDAIGGAGKLGIRSDRAVRYECDGAGTILNYSVLSETVGKLRCCEAVAADWSKDITEHFNKKNRK